LHLPLHLNSTTSLCCLWVIYYNQYLLFQVLPFSISLPGPIQGAMVGSPLMIQCIVNGVESGSVVISWMGPGRDTIISDSRVTIAGTGVMSTLDFMYLMEGDEGTYMCNVMSSFGGSGSQSVEIETLTSK